MKKVSIIVLNYNGWEDTEECLESVRKVETGSWKLEIVIVDNGSERILNQIQDDVLNIKIIRSEKNLGFAEGNNIGIRYALENGADYVLLLNNDTLVHKNLISELLKVMEADEKIGIAGPKIYFAPGYEFHKNRYQQNEKGKVIWYAGGVMDWDNIIGRHRGVDEVDHGQYNSLQETNFATGCCMMIKREVFGKIGLLDAKYFLYYEDNDFCQKAKVADFKIFYSPKAFLWHKNAGSAGGSGSSLQDYYTTRNRLLFGLKYAPIKSKIALIKESVKLLLSGRNFQKKGIVDFYLKKFGKGSFNVSNY